VGDIFSAVSRSIAALAFCVGITFAGVAHAHPLVDEARGKYEEAAFEGALDTLTRAEAADDLTRDDLVAVYELRVMVHLGMGEEDVIETDLRRLLSIDPSHDFGDGAPPDILRQASQLREELGGPIHVSVRASPGPAGLSLRAQVDHDPEELTRTIRIATRRGDSAWQSSRGSSLELPGGEHVAFYAEAVGPGGVVLAADGSEAEPRIWEGGDGDSDTDDGEGPPWLWIGIGAGAAVGVAAIIIIIAVAASGSSDQTNPTLPMVSFD